MGKCLNEGLNELNQRLNKLTKVDENGVSRRYQVVPYTEGGNFQILNLLCQQVWARKTGQRLDISALPQGMYVLKVVAEQAKFVKQ